MGSTNDITHSVEKNAIKIVCQSILAHFFSSYKYPLNLNKNKLSESSRINIFVF